jgi:hypothetical protein
MNQDLRDSESALAFIQQLNVNLLVVRCLALVTELRITERLEGGPKRAEALALELGMHADSLYRVLRLVASYGFFAEDSEGRFAITPVAQLLEKGVEGSLWDRLRLPWQDLLWATYSKLPQSVQTGVPAFELAFGEPFFDHLAADPELNLIFDRSMARFSSGENVLVAAAYPFEGHPQVIDVGGGQGGLLAEILQRHASVQGVLFDQAQVVAAPNYLKLVELEGRWRTVEGNFFDAVPAGGSLYVLKRIIHDWPDVQAGQILRRIRAVMPESGRLLVIDAVLGAGNEPDPNKFMDVNIMALLRGRERSEREFRALLAAAGFELLRVIALPRPASVSVIEARPA